ncbi:LPS export ABC transporter periplasmic protein LptC [Aestuariivivens sediminis]|uniref:LPS export ABC transporter periplasmic protein LptC n=1 Tax=Aestuariivivens sediminis TaxID=2913557 RepID=UPI001F580523|nr:LPS export ABC transporter periplasmic protein LptC [Aestuariivivens sediminis]
MDILRRPSVPECRGHKRFLITAVLLVLLMSCKDNFSNVQTIGISENEPIGVAEQIHLKYTDSGRIKAILVSPKMLDYSNREFAFSEFPEGIVLDLFDEDHNKSVVVADYAINYDKTNLIDLQGNVRIATHNKDTLFAEQLYYDQDKEWLFTNKPVTFKTESDIIHGNIFDSDTKFNNASVLEPTGNITVEE